MSSDLIFKEHRTASLPAQNNIHRLKRFRKFLGVTVFPTHLACLDVGAENFISKSLGITDNTTGDLNEEMVCPKEEYDVITAFEVINHVYNQGVFLDNIYSKLRTGGSLYLSTPLRWGISTIHGVGNYCEMTELSMRTLLEYKGFKILRYETHRSYPFRYVFSGLLQPLRAITGNHVEDGVHAPKMQWKYFGMRPIVKFLLHKFMLIEAVKA